QRTGAEEELTDAAGGREAATAALYLLRSTGERLALRRESLAGLAGQLRADLDSVRAAGPAAAVELEGAAREAAAAAHAAPAEREGLPPAARALAEEGEELALTRLEAAPGQERAVAASLAHRASAVLAANVRRALELVDRARAAGLGSLFVLVGRDPREL